jgi:hypothetical protein
VSGTVSKAVAVALTCRCFSRCLGSCLARLSSPSLEKAFVLDSFSQALKLWQCGKCGKCGSVTVWQCGQSGGGTYNQQRLREKKYKKKVSREHFNSVAVSPSKKNKKQKNQQHTNDSHIPTRILNSHIKHACPNSHFKHACQTRAFQTRMCLTRAVQLRYPAHGCQNDEREPPDPTSPPPPRHPR